MKATWITDYDFCSDNCYQRPGCAECYAPVILHSDGKIRCVSCGKEYELDEYMKAWNEKRKVTKKEFHDCITPTPINGILEAIGCGGKKCVEVIYTRNPVTLEWQIAYGKCKKCGLEFIV
jgi:hypothetical protein